MYKIQTNQRLGYPPDARLLILNADDFGMCNSVNEAIIQVLAAGTVHSTSLMVPCPWARHAMRFLVGHPEIHFGVHLTIISDAEDYYWGPVSPREAVPTLVDRSGAFYHLNHNPERLAQADLGQVEVEFRAQIEAVLAAGLRPDHLDWHSLRIQHRPDVYDRMLKLANEYRLPLRAIDRLTIDQLKSQGIPGVDHEMVDSYGLDPAGKSAHYARMLRELPSGLSEWAIHPGLDNSELLALEPNGNHTRQADFDFWTSQEAKGIVNEEGIILLDYQALKAIWNL